MENIIQRINKASLKLLEPLTLQQTYKRIATLATQLVKGEEGKLVLMKNRTLEVVYSTVGDYKKMSVRKNGHTYNSFRKKKAFVIYEKEIKDVDSKKGYQSVIFIPLYYKSKSFGVLIIKSTEEQQFTEKELQILKLFGSIASLTLRKSELLAETKKNLELKDKFISLAAHELRTPLTSMSGFIQLLHRRISREDIKEAEWIDYLLQESNRLKVLTEEILDINKMNAGKIQLTYEEIDLPNLILESVEEVKKIFPQSKIKVHPLPTNIVVIGDRDKLKKALFNILENAVKFSPEDKEIEIKMKKSKSNSRIEVIDYGIGIDQEDLPYIFEGFYKAKGNEREGMGLGLYFSQNVIQKLQGKLSVRSEKNKGTCVEVQLPIAEET
jgi:signal transduction histidine kinase